MAKRHCRSSSSFSPDPPAVVDQNHSRPLPLPTNPPSDMDALLETFLGLSDSATSSINLSFDRLIDSRTCDEDQNDMIDRSLRLGSVLLEAAKRVVRKRSSIHNAVVWPLPHDLTVKVLSMLDTRSVCYAAAACLFFQKCAMDSLCFADINLTTAGPKVNDAVVSTLIQRAGKSLQSIKLGIVLSPIVLFGSRNYETSRHGNELCNLTRSCLTPLSAGGGVAGALLRRLHLYNIESMDTTALCSSLSACQSLRDLEIDCLHVELRCTLESVSKHCPLLERLSFESSITYACLNIPTCNELVHNCPGITSLTLRDVELFDDTARILVTGFRKLKYVDFSTSYRLTGAFLKNLGGGNHLEVLILRDCMDLKEVEVEQFMVVVLAGEFRMLKHLDISNQKGLVSKGDGSCRCCSASFIPTTQLLEQRPDFCLVAEFPSNGSFVEVNQMGSGDRNSDLSSPSRKISSSTSDQSSFSGTSDSSNNSDPGSGNEDSQENSL